MTSTLHIDKPDKRLSESRAFSCLPSGPPSSNSAVWLIGEGYIHICEKFLNNILPSAAVVVRGEKRQHCLTVFLPEGFPAASHESVHELNWLLPLSHLAEANLFS